MSINTLMEAWFRQAETMGEFHRQELRETGSAWARLLRHGGVLLNMDANWLLPLWENEAAAQFRTDEAELVRRYGPFQDYYHDRDMMDMLRRVPLAFQERPAWDEALCRKLGLGVESVPAGRDILEFLSGSPLPHNAHLYASCTKASERNERRRKWRRTRINGQYVMLYPPYC